MNHAVEVLKIEARQGLDPITVFVENHAAGVGRITIQCYARAWTAYWGAMGGRSIQQFVLDADTDYVVGNLVWGHCGLMLKRHEARENEYLGRIVRAVKAALAAQRKPLAANDANAEAVA